MKKVILLIFLITSISSVQAQKINVDSIIQEALSKKEHSGKLPSPKIDSLVKKLSAGHSVLERVKQTNENFDQNIPGSNSPAHNAYRGRTLSKEDLQKLKSLATAGQTLAKITRDSAGLNNLAVSLASFYGSRHMTDSGLYYAKKAYNGSRKQSPINRVEPALLLARLYKGNNTDSALKYTEVYYRLRDSIQNFRRKEQATRVTLAAVERQQELEKQKTTYQNNLRQYVLITVITFLILLILIFWRSNKKRSKANLLLNRQKDEIQSTLEKLKQTQQQLIHSEKMASLGELTAGIAHEIQNPLNFVNNFSEVSKELLEELEAELDKGELAEARLIAADVIENLVKINHHGKRADGIVKGMLQHSRTST
ncbi:MAG: hypothetical protein EOP45_17960, partial [Sphingobacteriaceae bacterium]